MLVDVLVGKSKRVEDYPVAVIEDVKAILGQTLQLGDRAATFEARTPLFGSIPEFDSMAVVTVVAALEDRFGIVIDDDEITEDLFETVGALSRYIETKIGH